MLSHRQLTRRDFIKLCAMGSLTLAFSPYFWEGEELDGGDHLVRVAVNRVSVYEKPSDKSQILFQRSRNELIHVYYEVISEDGPKWNPIWYRVWGGYIHRAHLETVKIQLNPILPSVPDSGRVFEVTVPYTRSMWYTKFNGWQDNYLLYYGSNHWVVDIDEGPDKEPWYVIENDLLKLNFFVPATHLRAIPYEEMSPLKPDLPLEKKRIEISIVDQAMRAYEDDKLVLDTKVSTGLLHKPLPGIRPLATPKGEFRVGSKMPCKHMGGGFLTDDPEEYVLPGVPWTSFFELETGVAIHGTYWHSNWGLPMSHGCINMTNDTAKFIYRWSDPKPDPEVWHSTGFGTLVVVY